ncbi:hypothetical protein BGZ89_000160 [Linnemannia elongata]|nr:hypothetical protein BGZ89_000160 [Linnemannia elongata]
MVAILKTLVFASAVAISIIALSPAQAGPIVVPTTAEVIKQRRDCSVSEFCIAKSFPAQQTADVSLQVRADNKEDQENDMRNRLEKLFDDMNEHFRKSIFPPVRLIALFGDLLKETREKQLDMGDAIAEDMSKLNGRIKGLVCLFVGPILTTFGLAGC